jgi:hypothetical protein
MNDEAALDNYLELPAYIRAGLDRRDYFNVRVSRDGVTISTIPQLYGHKKSRRMLVVPREQIRAVEYVPRAPKQRGGCRIQYLDETSQDQTLWLTVVNATYDVDLGLTERVARTLQDIRFGKKHAIPQTFTITLETPRSLGQWILRVTLLACLWLLAHGLRLGVLSIPAAIVFGLSLVRFALNYLPRRIDWRVWVKFTLLGLSGAAAIVVILVSIYWAGFY